MNKALSQLCAEFEKMEQTIAFQQKVIASTAQVPVCPCGRLLLERDRHVCSVRHG